MPKHELQQATMPGADLCGLATSGPVSTGVQLLASSSVLPEACLPVSSCLLVFRLVCVRGFLLFRAEGTHSAEAPWAPSIPRTGFSGASLLLYTRYAVGRSHTRCYDQAERKALNVSLKVEDIVAPTPSACSGGDHAGFASRGKDTRMTASHSSWFRLSSH